MTPEEKLEAWEKLKQHGFEDLIRRHIQVFGKPERVSVKEKQ